MSVRALIVDDSAIVRTAVRRILSAGGVEVVGAAPDPYVARDLMVRLRPDVLVLDMEMPRMDGLTFLRKLMVHMPTPVVVLSSLTPKGSETALDALAAGAVAVMSKPAGANSVGAIAAELVRTVRAAAGAQVRARSRPRGAPVARLNRTTNQVLAVGASTGGTVAIEHFLGGLPVDCPGVLVTQHMPAMFTARYAERLRRVLPLDVRQAQDGDAVVDGCVLIAPGDRHMSLARDGARYLVRLIDGPPVNFHRPSVDVMFSSVARLAGSNAIGVLLTGMGKDGARGLLAMREAGAPTVGEAASTCVVYGMPAAAKELGAVAQELPLDGIANAVLASLKQKRAA